MYMCTDIYMNLWCYTCDAYDVSDKRDVFDVCNICELAVSLYVCICVYI